MQANIYVFPHSWIHLVFLPYMQPFTHMIPNYTHYFTLYFFSNMTISETCHIISAFRTSSSFLQLHAVRLYRSHHRWFNQFPIHGDSSCFPSLAVSKNSLSNNDVGVPISFFCKYIRMIRSLQWFARSKDTWIWNLVGRCPLSFNRGRAVCPRAGHECAFVSAAGSSEHVASRLLLKTV